MSDDVKLSTSYHVICVSVCHGHHGDDKQSASKKKKNPKNCT